MAGTGLILRSLDGKAGLSTFGLSSWDPFVVWATCLLLQSPLSSEPYWLWSQMVHKFPQRLHIPLLELVGTSSRRASGNPFPHTPLWQMPRVWKYLLCTAWNQESTPPSSERSPRFILLILMLLLVYPSGSMHLRHIGLSSSHHLCCSLQDQRGFL